MHESVYAAVDPGVNGGVAVVGSRGDIALTALPREDESIIDVFEGIRAAGVHKIALENIVLFNGQRRPGASMAVYAASFGFIKGVIMAMGFTLSLVTPQQWQTALKLTSADVPKTKWKSHLAESARGLFPGTKVTLKTADAALIAAAVKTGDSRGALTVTGTLRCGVCCRLLSRTQFYAGTKGGGRCKECKNYQGSLVWRNYGISDTEYEYLMEQHDGRCGICGETPEKLNIDHDHTSGVVRGLLCRPCNTGLGLFRDSTPRLNQAIAYLSKPTPLKARAASKGLI